MADEFSGPTYSNRGGLIPDLMHGPKSMKVAVALYQAAFPHLQITVEGLAMAGELVELRWVARDTAPTAQAPGILADRPNVLAGTTLSRVGDDQIVERWTSWDRRGRLRYLGVRLPQIDGEAGGGTPVSMARVRGAIRHPSRSVLYGPTPAHPA